MTTLPSRIFTRRRALRSGVAVAAVAPLLPRTLMAQSRELVIFNWDSYIDGETIPEFERETGIRVQYELFGSNDELFAKLRAGNPGYDLIFPSNDWVARMIAAEMLEPLDKAQLDGLDNIAETFMDPPHDPGRMHSVPYFWGTLGIGYRSSVAAPTSWSTLFTDATHDGRIALLRSKDSLEAALKYLGYSLNATEPAKIEEAVELLIAAKPRIKQFAPDTAQDLLLADEVDVCLEYNGDILQVMEEDDDLAYVVPEEGSQIWEDCMCIPKGAPNPDAAHAFISHILQPEVKARIAEWVLYPTPNVAAKALLPEAIRNNPSIYPSDEVLARCEFSKYQGEAIQQMRDDAMTRVLAA